MIVFRSNLNRTNFKEGMTNLIEIDYLDWQDKAGGDFFILHIIKQVLS